jgi:hypothetical protein
MYVILVCSYYFVTTLIKVFLDEDIVDQSPLTSKGKQSNKPFSMDQAAKKKKVV